MRAGALARYNSLVPLAADLPLDLHRRIVVRSQQMDPVRPYEIAKPGGGTRRMAALSPRDAAVWHELAGRVAPLLEDRMDARVIANRALVGSGGWRLVSVERTLERARRAARSLVAHVPVVATDVRSFYPSIRPDVLGRCLRRAGADGVDAELAARMLEGWEGMGYRGLPIGPPASAVLANAILLPVDRALGEAPFVRWVDDYLLPASFPLPRLDRALASVGLRRAAGKTGPLGGQPWPARSAAGYRPGSLGEVAPASARATRPAARGDERAWPRDAAASR